VTRLYRRVKPLIPVMLRLLTRVAVNDETGCWEWTGTLRNGYGAIGIDSVKTRMTTRYTHRLVYEALVGPIPDDRQIDHLCRNRRCCNPAHLEVVTGLVNVRRGTVGQVNGDRKRNQTHCKRGHPLSGENLYRHGIRRHCRRCRTEWAWQARHGQGV
jgi:hypothetical protein